MDYNDIAQRITPLAKEAGKLALKYFRQPILQDTKGSSIDIVTEADKAVEVYLMGELLKMFPDHHFVGEEGGGQGAPAEEADYLWFIDPIDGTTNFASGIPHFCTSIGMTDKHRQPLLGLIYNPNRDDLYLAIKGHGATLNGETMQVSTTNDLINAVLLTGFPYDHHTNPNNNFKEWKYFMTRTRAVRVMGSAALDFAAVAAGHTDGFWELTLEPWDAMAGMLLVTESGGTVTDYDGHPTPHMNGSGYLASNGILHQTIMETLRNGASS